VTRNTGDLRGKDSPDGVTLTVPIKDTNLSAEVALQANTLHGPGNSIESRNGSGERVFSTSSRWHCDISLGASNSGRTSYRN
jgi:hypothetical protein